MGKERCNMCKGCGHDRPTTPEKTEEKNQAPSPLPGLEGLNVLGAFTEEQLEAEIRSRRENELDCRISFHTPHRCEWGLDQDKASDAVVKIHDTLTGRDQNEKVLLEVTLLDLVESYLENQG